MTPGDLAKELARRQAVGKVDILAALTAASGEKPWFGDLLLRALAPTGADLSVTASGPPSQVGALVTLSGAASLLNLDAAPVALTFKVPDQGPVELDIAITPAAWRLSQSFPLLAGDPGDNFVFSDILLFFTTETGKPSPWTPPKGQPTPREAVQGLNLACQLDVASAFGAFAGFIGTNDPVVFSGAIGPPLPSAWGLPLPTLDLTGSVAKSPPAMAHFPLGVPQVALRTPLDWTGSSASLPIAQLSLTLEVAGTPLEFWAARVEGSAATLLYAETPAGKVISPADIVQSLLAGTDYKSLIPDPLISAFGGAGLASAALDLDLGAARVTAVSVDIGVDDIALGPIKLEQIVGRFLVLEPGGANRISAAIRCQFAFLPTVFTGAFAAQVWRGEGATGFSGGYQGDVTLGALLAAASDNALTPPAAIADIAFSDFGVDFVSADGGWDWTLYGTLNLLHQVQIAGVTVDADLQILVASVGGTKTYRLVGGLIVADQVFSAELDLGGAEKRLIASWTDTGTPLGLEAIAGFFGWNMPPLPEGLDLNLQQATLYVDLAADQLAVSAVSATYGTLVFVSFKSSDAQAGRVQVVALEPDWRPSLGMLPLVGPQLPSAAAPFIGDFQILAASVAVSEDMPTVQALFASVEAQPPGPPVLAQGVTLSAQLQDFGGQITTIALPLARHDAPSNALAGSASANPEAASAAAPVYGGAASWVSVDRTVGPITLKRIGVQYQDQKLGVLFDASAQFASLSVGLDGLGLTSPLSRFSPSPTLSGLEVGFSTGPVDVSGGLLRLADGSFAGDLTVEIDPYVINASGAFGQAQGHQAFFVFADVQGDFGGPPAFFVTGFLGGLGHNYALTMPGVDQVHTFPFLAGMDDPSVVGGVGAPPLSVLDALATPPSGVSWITPTVGARWIAAGVDFRSFEMIYGRVMVAVVDGADFEIALLGLAHMSLPQDAGDGAYAYIELQLDAALKPSDGSFSALASLTANSYLLTHDCHLTGGFAFCLWFGDSPYAGDFVLTAGGYSPAFVPPSWYPQVDRVGFNWAVGDDVTVKGGAYFALTPTAAMAGGSLEVLFQSGDLKAWLTAYADLMIRWKPFYFTADIGISVGASYRLNLLFTSVTLSVELGATLELYGPPTGGKVHVHWTVISFTIGFGADPPSPDDLVLNWDQFRTLLPQKDQVSQTAGKTPIEIHIARGLLRTDSTVGWVVRADELVLVTSCKAPSTAFQIGGATPALPDGAAKTLNIRPMQLAGVASTHKVSLDLEGAPKPPDLADWSHDIQLAALPSALWGAPLASDGSGGVVDPPATAELVAGLATGARLTAPAAKLQGQPVGPFGVEVLDPLGGGYLPLDPAHQTDPTPAPTPDPHSVATIKSTLASPGALKAQAELLADLDPASRPPTSAPLARMADAADRLFAQPPMSIGGADLGR